MTTAAAAARPVRTAGRPTMRRTQARTAWLFLSPAVLFFVLMFFLPIGNQLIAGAYSDDGTELVGFGNITRALSDPEIRHSFAITLLYGAGCLVVGMVVGLALAVILNQAIAGRTVFRSVLLIPYLTSVSIVGLLWRNILDPQVGILNRTLAQLGLPGQSWLSTHPLATIVAITVWSSAGYTMVLFLAGLQGIPGVYYEAALIDGAGPWQRFGSITLPLLAPTTLFVSIIGAIGALQQFALPYIVTGGGPGNATSLYAHRLFVVAFNDNEFGYAAGLSLLLLVVILTLSLVQLRIGERTHDYA